MESRFFTFIKPYLQFIDSGHLFRKPFSWLYMLIAGFNLLIPIYVFYKASEAHIFDAPGKFILAFILIWAVIAMAGWISFQLWWDRRSKVTETSNEGDDFVATPVFAHFIQTMGEWIGSWVAFVGCAVGLFTTIFLGDDAYRFSREIGVDFLEGGFLAMIIMPVYGFMIIVISRFLAEQFRALSSIANNTRK